jgi:hypothetical protein
MAGRPKTIDVSNLPEVRKIAEEVDSSNEPRVLRRGATDLALVTPLRRGRGRARGKALTADDPLMSLVGIGRSGLGDVSENTHKYLAEAYETESE